jgi:hypothetical protein
MSQNDGGGRFLKQNEHGWWIDVESKSSTVIKPMKKDDTDHNSHESEVSE